jgi:asparagine synthase (glutamine-hydrolysing)
MTMAHGLEARVPWLDNSILYFAFYVPPSLTVHNGTEKYLFRRAMQPCIPKHTFEKKKRGFGVPCQLWLNQNRAELLSAVNPMELQRQGIFRAGHISRLLKKREFSLIESDRLWNLILFSIWHEKYFE